ncbi:MAG: tetratricopeptide repeat protein [Acidobacteria bacterium]|nr:tetratricopeptide repeat protein [Acidobacteriota bacterium]
MKEAEAPCTAAARLAARLGAGRELEKMGAYEQVGVVMMGEGRYREALGYYARALETVRGRLTDRNAEVGQLYGEIAMAHHSLRELDKALEFYRRAEKTYQVAYAAIDPEKVTEEGVEIKRSYLRTLRRIFQAHILAADQAGATSEAKEIRRQLDSLEHDSSS